METSFKIKTTSFYSCIGYSDNHVVLGAAAAAVVVAEVAAVCVLLLLR